MNTHNTLNNTILALDLFQDDIKSATVIHIPHSSDFIPKTNEMDMKLVKSEIKLLTDWQTEKIFDIKGCTKIVVPFSRVFCDVERLPDNMEPMQSKGRGFYYTHTDSGKRFRNDNTKLKQEILESYYRPHHSNLFKVCQDKIEKHGFCLIIDAHSFSEIPLKTEENQDLDRPDICLGTDSFHTPKSMLTQFSKHFESYGLTVAINKPYSGTIVPLPLYQKEERVWSIMIEVNKRLYMKKEEIVSEKVEELRKIMNELF